jgi:transposase-like protein
MLKIDTPCEEIIARAKEEFGDYVDSGLEWVQIAKVLETDTARVQRTYKMAIYKIRLQRKFVDYIRTSCDTNI